MLNKWVLNISTCMPFIVFIYKTVYKLTDWFNNGQAQVTGSIGKYSWKQYGDSKTKVHMGFWFEPI